MAKRGKGKLKCWTGNLDGRRDGLVVATSKTEAARVAGTGLADFNNYWCEVPVLPQYQPGVLYTRRYGFDAAYQEGRCDVQTRR